MIFFALVVVPMNLLFLPVAALMPCLGPSVNRFLRSCGRSSWDALPLNWSSTYLLDVPAFKFTLWTISNVLLAAMITMLPLSIHHDQNSSFGVQSHIIANVRLLPTGLRPAGK